MVDAQPRDDGREICACGADVGVLVLTRPEPRVLHDILGFAGAAEHPVRNREQQRSMRLERCLVPLSGGHGSPYLALPPALRRMKRAICDSGVPRHRLSPDDSRFVLTYGGE